MPLIGNTHVISATPTKLSASTTACRKLTIRANLSGSQVFFGDAGGTKMGYLVASATTGESWTFEDVRPEEIYIWGAAGEDLFWNGVPS